MHTVNVQCSHQTSEWENNDLCDSDRGMAVGSRRTEAADLLKVLSQNPLSMREVRAHWVSLVCAHRKNAQKQRNTTLGSTHVNQEEESEATVDADSPQLNN